MEVSLTNQLFVICLSLTLGVLLGALYDGVRILRCLFGIRYKCPVKRLEGLMRAREERTVNRVYESLVMGVTDILYFILSACIIAVFVYGVNNGRVRWYIYLGAAVGFFAYYSTVGKIVISFSSIIACGIRRAIRIFAICMYSPFKPLAELVKKTAVKVRRYSQSKREASESVKRAEGRRTLLHYGKQ